MAVNEEACEPSCSCHNDEDYNDHDEKKKEEKRVQRGKRGLVMDIVWYYSGQLLGATYGSVVSGSTRFK